MHEVTTKYPRKATAKEEVESPQWQETTAACKTNQPALQPICMHTANQRVPGSASLCICTEKAVAVLQPGRQQAAGCGQLSARAVYSLLTANSNCNKPSVKGHGCSAMEKNEVWNQQIAVPKTGISPSSQKYLQAQARGLIIMLFRPK